MKYRILTVIIVLLTILNMTVSALGYEYSITPSDNFTFAKQGDDLTQIAKKLNMTTDDLNKYFSDNKLIYLAVSDDVKSQIKISVTEDEFSKKVNDISILDDNALNNFAKSLSSDSSIVTNNDRKFVLVNDTHKDSGGIYTVTQYITICDGKTFYFIGYNDGKDISKEITSVFKTFTLNQQQSDSADNNVFSIVIIIGIVVFGMVAIIMVIGIIRLKIKDYKESKDEKIEN
ncbi:MAG: hypothetical protein IJZ63_04170 [Clostridia bacterium]|nr:hypothetical protein [Clostridia bacterium]